MHRVKKVCLPLTINAAKDCSLALFLVLLHNSIDVRMNDDPISIHPFTVTNQDNTAVGIRLELVSYESRGTGRSLKLHFHSPLDSKSYNSTISTSS